MLRISLISLLVFLEACGPAGPRGLNGESGLDGQDGARGPRGAPGQDASGVTPIQLCPGVTPTYPSTFPEYALCLQGKLYGVYSSQGGFLALLPPGQYTSTGINASCTITVDENCEITR